MGFLTSLLGSDNAYLTAVMALGVVVILILVGVWLLKVISDASRNAGRGRSRRLGVVDSVPLDQRRQAILLRRDNVEHLIVTGGPQDLVVETGIESPVSAQRGTAARGSESRARDQRTAESLGRREAPPVQVPAPGRTRQVAPARQRETLRNARLARPSPPGEVHASGGIGQNGQRDPVDSAIADMGDGDQGAAGFETAEIGGERDHNQGADERRRKER